MLRRDNQRFLWLFEKYQVYFALFYNQQDFPAGFDDI